MDTKQVNKVILHGDILKKTTDIQLYDALRVKVNEKYKEKERKYFEQKWIKFAYGTETGYWHKDECLAICVQSKYELSINHFDISCTAMNEKQVSALFSNDCPKEIVDGIKASREYDGGHWIGFDKGSYCIETKRYANWNDEDSVSVGVVFISNSDFKKAILSQKFTICSDNSFKRAVELLKTRSILQNSKKEKSVSNEEIDQLVEILEIDRKNIEQSVTNEMTKDYKMSLEHMNSYIEHLLACDRRRADLENYDRKCLEDVNSGHWELWYDKEPSSIKGQICVTLDKALVARNPIADIHEDGLIGIDFGTKSTIVSKRDGREKMTLLRVGTGQLNKKATAHHYENPTIMEFIDFDSFLIAYNEKIGRPQTSIDDLRVSHTANNDLKACNVSDAFYSFFYDIKQWCGDTERNVKLIDQKGVEHVLPAFVNLGKNDFNPLELYAYYLGLYINNMRNGIYLDYVLSFPVTYEKSVKEKILESFVKGLKKSLPQPVLDDKAAMAKFRVRQGVSEPAAYAITALQGYGFEPEGNEKVLYSIFDFGGGTTDFDFGLWRCADDDKREEQRYDYVIEHFGSEGDKYLGGENLLELMAYEVFKANADYLGKRKSSKENDEEQATAGFSFSKPKECDAFPGSETLISDSQEARRNTKQLMEALRPFWEGIISVDKAEDKKESAAEVSSSETIAYNGYVFKNTAECQFPIKDGAIKVDLFDKDGNRKAGQILYVENAERGIHLDLIHVLEKRIEIGVSNFFTSIYLAFRNENAVRSGVEGIQIFLAGNSSKSPILHKIFEEYIEKERNTEHGRADKTYYELFPPLGTKEAVEIQREKGIKIDENDITAPTGKTGVAYGLIAGREGGKIKIIAEAESEKQTKFRYNIGVSKKRKFTIVLDRNKIGYGEWVKLIDARVGDFEIYYTSLPNAAKMSVDEMGIYNKCCRLPFTDENSDVYIRCVEDSPEDIEYCVSKNGKPSEETDIVRIHLGE